jgi:hypothetical protein
MLFDFKKEQKVTMNMKDMNYPLDMIYQHEQGSSSYVQPGNFETSVGGVRFVLEVNKDEGGTCRELISLSDLLSAVGMAEETEAPLVDAETEEEEELRRVSKHDTY